MKQHLSIHFIPFSNNLYDRITSYSDNLRLAYIDQWFQIANEVVDLNRPFTPSQRASRVYIYLGYLQNFRDLHSAVTKDLLLLKS